MLNNDRTIREGIIPFAPGWGVISRNMAAGTRPAPDSMRILPDVLAAAFGTRFPGQRQRIGIPAGFQCVISCSTCSADDWLKIPDTDRMCPAGGSLC
jgi:hypothetical protein